MDRSNFLPLRSLPRVFLANIPVDFRPIEIPAEEYQKFHKVLRLGNGDQVAILPGDGRILRCELDGHYAVPLEEQFPGTEPSTHLTLIQALPRMDKLENIVRLGTEIGVSHFVFFHSDRTVVRWDQKKLQEKMYRLRVIATESAEVSYRMHLPEMSQLKNLKVVLEQFSKALVLDESEKTTQPLQSSSEKVELVVGPEGGWSPRESEWIADRGVTLGPRVLRVETAAVSAVALVLLKPDCTMNAS